MNRTPLLRPLRDIGSTLYIFPSASEDIGLNLDSRVNGAALSHFALLNIPNFESSNLSDGNNYLAELLLNYVMNFETVLLNQDNYNYQDYSTVSEKVFWHWVIDNQHWFTFNDVSTDIYKSEYSRNKFIYNDLDRFILCFGSIDAGNTLSTEFGMFNETYINIPTSYGNGPVFLKSYKNDSENKSKKNYILGNKYKSTVNNKLEGRDENNTAYSYLSNMVPIYDDSSNYYKDSYGYEIVKDLYDIQSAINNTINLSTIDGTDTNKSGIIINSFDDINIDTQLLFKNTIYDITSNKCEYTFNAILLYYSVYDNNDDTKTPYAINLFGIIFLDGSRKLDSGKYKIDGLTKRKSFGGESDSFFGNSYSFRVNLKTMSVYDDTSSTIMDNTTMSSIDSVVFSDVISNLNNAISMMNTNLYATIDILNKYNEIVNILNDDRKLLEDVSTQLYALTKGSSTTSLALNQLNVSTILPAINGNNEIKLSVYRQLYDTTDDSEISNYPYITPVIINSDYNVPNIYKASIINNNSELHEISNNTTSIYDIINNTDILYYTNSDTTNVYQHIVLPIETINDLKLSYLYKYVQLNNTIDSSIQYINYDAYMPLIIEYIKMLNNRIKELENKLENN